jgi:hypothetical protein
MAAKRKSWLGELWRPLAALLLWVLGMGPLIAAPPLPSLAETRVGGLTILPADFIQASSLLTIESHRACAPPLYDLASGCSVAANRVAPLGRGSTADLAKGTTLPRNLREQLGVEQAMSRPGAGATKGARPPCGAGATKGARPPCEQSCHTTLVYGWTKAGQRCQLTDPPVNWKVFE